MFSDHIETMYFLILPVNGFFFAKKITSMIFSSKLLCIKLINNYLKSDQESS